MPSIFVLSIKIKIIEERFMKRVFKGSTISGSVLLIAMLFL